MDFPGLSGCWRINSGHDKNRKFPVKTKNPISAHGEVGASVVVLIHDVLLKKIKNTIKIAHKDLRHE